MSRSIAWQAADLIDKKENSQEVDDHATGCLEPETRAPVQAHQGEPQGTRNGRKQGGRDRRPDREQGPSPCRRSEAGEPDVHRRYLVGAARWVAVAHRLAWSDLRTAPQRGARARHQGPLSDEQSTARTRRRRQKA